SDSSIVSYRLRRWSVVEEMSQGDIVFAYIADLKTFAGVLTVTDAPYKDNKQSTWFTSNSATCYVPVNVLAKLQFEDWVPVVRFQNQLSYLRDAPSLSEAITNHFVESPVPEIKKDSVYLLRRLRATIKRRMVQETRETGKLVLDENDEAVEKAFDEAAARAEAETDPAEQTAEPVTAEPEPAPPVAATAPPAPAPTPEPEPVHAEPAAPTAEAAPKERPAAEPEIRRNPPQPRRTTQAMTFDPAADQKAATEQDAEAAFAEVARRLQEDETEEQAEPKKEGIDSKDIILLICEIGQEIGVSLWMPRKVREEIKHEDVIHPEQLLGEELPESMDGTMRELLAEIDVLWVKDNQIVSVFDVETDENVLAGLVRLNDINLARPDKDVQLYIVAPVEMREWINTQICRPSFVSSTAPLVNSCRFIPYETLNVKVRELENLGVLKYIQPTFLEELAVDF
ncbi:MAG: hypothetical protein AAF787_15875, partial [Chloroflexota bacterium]